MRWVKGRRSEVFVAMNGMVGEVFRGRDVDRAGRNLGGILAFPADTLPYLSRVIIRLRIPIFGMRANYAPSSRLELLYN